MTVSKLVIIHICIPYFYNCTVCRDCFGFFLADVTLKLFLYLKYIYKDLNHQKFVIHVLIWYTRCRYYLQRYNNSNFEYFWQKFPYYVCFTHRYRKSLCRYGYCWSSGQVKLYGKDADTGADMDRSNSCITLFICDGFVQVRRYIYMTISVYVWISWKTKFPVFSLYNFRFPCVFP